MSEGGYIQGAGDDSESWAHGLTPPVFWENKSALLATDEEELPDRIQELMAKQRSQKTDHQAIRVAPTQNLYISRTSSLSTDSDGYDLVIDCNASPQASEGNAKRLNLGCGSAKLGSRDLRKSLDQVKNFVNTTLLSNPAQSLLVTCETGKDLSAGALLAILCLFYNDDGEQLRKLDPILCTADHQERTVCWASVTAVHGQTIHQATSRMDCHV